MSKPKSAARLEVEKYLSKFPNHPSRTIAAMLIEREPLLFKDFEAARWTVRHVRGETGTCMPADKSNLKPNKGNGVKALSCLPKPIGKRNKWEVKKIGFSKALILQDIHIPYQDNEALDIAIAHGKKVGVDCVILNGDVMDFYSISFWQNDPRERNFEHEVQSGRLFLEYLRDKFPKAEIYYKEGNHEERLWRHAWAKCPELVGLRDGAGKEIISLRHVMDTDFYGIKVVADKQPILAGEHLYILHGHEFRAPFVNPVNPARGLYLRTKANAFCGDMHQISAHSERGIEKVISCWSGGCLCDLRPTYCPLNKWSHGFAVVELNGSAWHVDNRQIINGHVV